MLVAYTCIFCDYSLYTSILPVFLLVLSLVFKCSDFFELCLKLCFDAGSMFSKLEKAFLQFVSVASLLLTSRLLVVLSGTLNKPAIEKKNKEYSCIQ